VKDRRNPRCKR